VSLRTLKGLVSRTSPAVTCSQLVERLPDMPYPASNALASARKTSMPKIATGGCISVAKVRVVVMSIMSFSAGGSSMGAPLAALLLLRRRQRLIPDLELQCVYACERTAIRFQILGGQAISCKPGVHVPPERLAQDSPMRLRNQIQPRTRKGHPLSRTRKHSPPRFSAVRRRGPRKGTKKRTPILRPFSAPHSPLRRNVLFDNDGVGKNRRWTFEGILQRLKSIQEQTLVIKDSEIRLNTTPDEEQQTILDLLKVKL
jgi:hypothetical protein